MDSPEVYVAVTLDRMGERYGMLPSEVLARASSLDLAVMDVSMSFQRARQDQQEGKLPMVSQDAMLAAVEKLKGA